MMKKIIASAMLVLPLVLTSLSTKALALEVIVNPRVQNLSSAPVLIAQARHRARHKVYIKTHWEGRGHYRHRIPAHWEWRN